MRRVCHFLGMQIAAVLLMSASMSLALAHSQEEYGTAYYEEGWTGDAVAVGAVGHDPIYLEAQYDHVRGAYVYPSRIRVQSDYSHRIITYRAKRVIYSGAGAFEMWSPDWMDYCAAKYRSFNARTGKYRTYQGSYRYCK